MVYAEWITRVLARLIDICILTPIFVIGYIIAVVVVLVVTMIASSISKDAGGIVAILLMMLTYLLVFVVAFAAMFYNFVWRVSKSGSSIGHHLMKIKVVDEQGQLLSLGSAFLRWLIQGLMGFVPFLPLVNLLFPLWDEKKQTLHDKVVGSIVVQNPS